MKDVVIIGSGPAGLSAAVYAKRATMDVVVVEKETFSGGQIINTEQVDNYLGLYGVSGYEIAMKYREHADKLDVPFINSNVKAIVKENNIIKLALANGETIESKAVVVATGASHRKLGVQGEKELAGLGISYCATCDGAFFRNRDVMVVGGGDVALQDAIYLSKLCRTVYIVHRRAEFRAAKSNVNKVKNTENIRIMTNYTVKEFIGQEILEQAVLTNVLSNEEETINVSGAFIAIGMKPETEIVRNLGICDEKGYVIAGEDCRTNVAGIYVAGDVRTKNVRQLATAVADGANVIFSIEVDF